MYQSPFKIVTKKMAIDIAEELDARVYRAAMSVGVTVDKDELIRALKYDRGQYDRGFNDGILAAADELVRCKDCVWYTEQENKGYRGHFCGRVTEFMQPDDFCSYGERRSDEDEDS